MKFYLQKVRLNQGGYDDSGRYFGNGEPLYYFNHSNEFGDIHEGYIRANDREHAKEKVRITFPQASFYR